MTKITQAPFITPGANTSIVVTDSLAVSRVSYNELVNQLSNDVQGVQGAQGSSTGSQGPQGIQGIRGFHGTQGTNGRAGSQGIQGISGSAVAKGDTGSQGIQGTQGIRGSTSVSAITADVLPTATNTYDIGSQTAIWKNIYAASIKNASNISLIGEREISVRDYGATGNSIDDDTVAIQNAINACSSAGGGIVRIPSDFRCLVDSADITIPSRVALVGTNVMPSIVSVAGGADYNLSSYKSTIILNPTYKINICNTARAHSGSVKGLYILKKGLVNLAGLSTGAANTQVSNFSGTAINIGLSGSNTSDCYVGHCHITGFAQAIRATTSDRITIENITGDCTNGLWITDSYDIARIRNCHFWPFLSYGYTATTPWRDGTSYKLDGTNDWTVVDNCFSFGYKFGFNIGVGSNHVTLTNCGVDGDPASTANAGRVDSVAFWITGSCCSLINCNATTHQCNFLIDSGNYDTRLTGCTAWGANVSFYHVYINSGIANITECSFNDAVANWAIAIGAGTVGFNIDNNVFNGTTKGIQFENLNLTIPKGNIGSNNRYISVSSGINNTNLGVGPTTSYFTRRFMLGSDPAGSATSNIAHIDAAARGTPDVQISLKGLDIITRSDAYGYNGLNWQIAGSTRVQVDYNPGGASLPGNYIPSAFVISTTGLGDTSLIDRVYVNSEGNVLPAIDNAYDLGSSDLKWQSIYAANGTINTSDRRLKTEITTSTLGLDFINDLRPVSYKWISGGTKVVRQVYLDENGNELPDTQVTPESKASPGRIITEDVPGNRTHWGLIAQEVKETLDKTGVDFGGWILSDMNNVNSTQHINYAEFIAPLIKAVQELSAQLEAVKSKLQ